MTAPGGILGLALMYLQTNDRSIAALFDIPGTAFALDLVRPDFILLRMLGRCLVLWDSILPVASWIGSQLPPLIKVCISFLGFHFSLVLGASTAIGLCPEYA